MNVAQSFSHAVAVQTQEEERYRIARAVQSGPGQLLANAAMEIETALRLMDKDPATARKGLGALLEELRYGLQDLQRLVGELQPPLLNDLGLVASLNKICADFSIQTGISIQLSGWERLAKRLPASMEIAVFRIVYEALDNVQRHSQATQVQVAFEQTHAGLRVTIEDNGRGFDLGTYGMTNTGRRLGLIAMRDRAEFLSGKLNLYSEIGKGTRVVLNIPTSA